MSQPDGLAWLVLVPILAVTALALGLIFLAAGLAGVRLERIASARRRSGRCEACGYDIAALQTCPECGACAGAD